MNSRYPSVDEVIATLSHSNLPTLITEGRDDYEAIRRVEERCSGIGLSVMAVGGRDAVISVFNRRHEIRGTTKVAFLADKDLWIFSEVPAELRDPTFLFTKGYSIENDLYVDGDIEAILTGEERVKFKEELGRILLWYSREIYRHLKGEEVVLDHHPNKILGVDGAEGLTRDSVVLTAGEREIFDACMRDYSGMLRGKTLIALALRFLSSSGRAAKYSRRSLLELGAARNGSIMTAAYERLNSIFA